MDHSRGASGFKGQGMHQGKVICRAVDADGNPCGESAIVHEVHYTYDASPPSFWAAR
jgi:hypothetical protein